MCMLVTLVEARRRLPEEETRRDEDVGEEHEADGDSSRGWLRSL